MSRHELGCGTTRQVGRAAAALVLLGAMAFGGGCARQETIQAADVTEAAVVTVRTLPRRTKSPLAKGRLARNETAKPEGAAEAPKAEPKPRRRRRPRKNPQPVAPVVAAVSRETDAADAGSTHRQPEAPAEPPKAEAPQPAAPPEHVIEPRPASPAPQPEPPVDPDGKSDG